MNNSGVKDQYNILTGMAILDKDWGIIANEDDYLEDALEVIDDVGIKHTETYKYVTELGDTYFIKLPPYCDEIKAVTLLDIDDLAGLPLYRVFNQSAQYIPGTYIKFKHLGSSIEILDRVSKGNRICISYVSRIVDEEGFPVVNKDVARMCAVYHATKYYRKKAIKGDTVAAQALPLAQEEFQKAKTRVFSPTSLTANATDAILNAITTYDRKLYGKSFKGGRR